MTTRTANDAFESPTGTARLPFRTLRRARPRRVDARAVVGAVLFAAGFLAAVAAWVRTTDGVAVLVTTRSVTAGEHLGPADVAVVRVRVADEEAQAAMVPASERERVVGQALAAPAQARQFLVRAQLGGTGLLAPDRVALTVPVTADSAAGGRVRPGDEVAVYVTRDGGPAGARTEELLPRATVFEVGYGAPGAVARAASAGGAGAEAGAVVPLPGVARAPVWITLVLSREQGQTVVQARRSGELDVALLPPRPAAPPPALQATSVGARP